MNTLFSQRGQRGAALFVALVITTLGLGLVLAIAELNKVNNEGADNSLARQNVTVSANAALNMVISDVWGRYQISPFQHFQNYTDRFGNPIAGYLQHATWSRYPLLVEERNTTTSPKAHDLTANFAGRRFGQSRITQARVSRTDISPATGVEPLAKLIFEVEVESDFVDETSTTKQPLRGWASRTVTVGFPAPYTGFDYAILTKNITCTFCHLKVQSLNKAHNKWDATLNGGAGGWTNGNPGDFVRTKVGTTDYMAIRPNQAESNIEGTLYQRGKFESEQDSNALPLTMPDLTGSTLKGVQYNPGKDTTKQHATNQATYESSFTNGGINPATGAPYPRETAYLQYPTDQAKMSDGPLPTDFPAPFTDLNANRKVDPAEITAAKADATGTITGGISRTVPIGQAYTAFQDGTGPTSRLPIAADKSAGKVSAANINGSTSGTVVLVGTYDDPIKLNGKVVIEGDLIIKGYVEGKGELWATGNIYAPGDVRYKNAIDPVDGKEIFGKNSSGQSNGKNLMGLMAGKSIVIGDYLSQVNHWSTGKTEFHNYGAPEPGRKLDGYPLAYTDTQGSRDSGQYPSGTTINGKNVSNYGKVNFANFVAEDIAFFNREEMTKNLLKVPTTNPRTVFYDKTTPYITNNANWVTNNAFYEPQHTPRYYTMYPEMLPSVETQANKQLAIVDSVLPVANRRTQWKTEPNVYLNDKTAFNTNINAATGKPQGWKNTLDPHTYNTVRQVSEIPAANKGPKDADKVVISIHPEWITPGDMFRIMQIEEDARPAEPRRFDGLMYTNNAIFAIERPKTQKYTGAWNEATQTFSGGTWSKVNSKSGGKMILNGAIIAPDLGVLVTGGTVESTTNFANATPIYRGGMLKYVQKAFTVNYDPRVQELLAPKNFNATKWALTEYGVSQGLGTLPPAP